MPPVTSLPFPSNFSFYLPLNTKAISGLLPKGHFSNIFKPEAYTLTYLPPHYRETCNHWHISKAQEGGGVNKYSISVLL